MSCWQSEASETDELLALAAGEAVTTARLAASGRSCSAVIVVQLQRRARIAIGVVKDPQMRRELLERLGFRSGRVGSQLACTTTTRQRRR